MYLTPGRNPVLELLRSSIGCSEVIIEQGIKPDEKITEILSLAKQKGIKVSEVANKQLDTMVDEDTPHQGVLAKAERFAPELNLKQALSENLNNQMYVYIREALYEHNAAAIIRTAECLGVSGVILPPKLQLSPNLSRIAMGANFHLPITNESLFNVIKMFHNGGYQIAALEINGDKNLYEANLTLPTLLIIGGEDRSISTEIASHVDQLMVIPQSGSVNSLNMSVAASLAMYERVRQLNKS